MYHPTSVLRILAGFALLGPLSVGARASVVLDSPLRHVERDLDATLSLVEGKLNEACVKAHIVRLSFKNLPKYPSDANFCETPVKDLPNDARALIEKIGELNDRVAEVFGLTAAEAFPMDVGITLTADFRGSINSKDRTDGVVLSVLPDWGFRDFSPKVYAHEIVHTLTFNAGPVADALVGLQTHPFLIEALPDLVSAAVHRSPKMEMGESGLPECLKSVRDESPIRSLDEPFRRYYPLAMTDDVIECCATLDSDGLSPFAKSLCNTYSWNRPSVVARTEAFIRENEIQAPLTDAAHLKTAFEASDCRIVTKTGLVFLDNCDSHQFGYPLVSFFFRLRELTGKLLVAAFFEKIREMADGTAVYECGYANGTETLGGTKAHVAIRPLLGAFSALRESLVPAERAAFDRAWNEHAFGKLVDLDRIYRSEMLDGLAQLAVRQKNRFYADLKDCESPYKYDLEACRIACEKKL